MNDSSKNNITYGIARVPENYCEFHDVILTTNEKLIIFSYQAKEIAVHSLFILFKSLGLTLVLGSIAFLSVILFKTGGFVVNDFTKNELIALKDAMEHMMATHPPQT